MPIDAHERGTPAIRPHAAVAARAGRHDTGHASRYVSVFTALLLGAAAPAAGADAQSLARLEEAAFRQAAAIAAPSVVRIDTVSGTATGTAPTTGILVSADGYVLSSLANFAARPTSILVELPDGRRFPAKQIASDHLRMLALLKIGAGGLTPIQTTDRADVRVGEWCIALGRTYATPTPSVSVGIVSALQRIWGKAIQTDANLSPVNYGGALVDIEGRAIGIVVPLSPNASGNMAGVEWYDSGIGFAIPIQDAFESFERLKDGDDLHRGLLGITLRRTDLYSSRPVIDRVRYGSPAENAGLRREDTIVAVDGSDIKHTAELRHALGNKYAGVDLTVVVEREGDRIERKLTLVAELPPYQSGYLGILPKRRALSADEARTGVVIRHVLPDSPASRAKLEPGDRILQLDEKQPENHTALLDIVGRRRPGTEITLFVDSAGRRRTVTVTLDSLPTRVPSGVPPVTIPPPGEAAGTVVDDKTRTGRFTELMEAHQHRFWAWIPDDYNPDHEYGLMVWLHPAGDTMEAAILQDWESIAERRGLIILGPHAHRPTGWTLNEAEFVKAATELLIERYSIDAKRVFLHCLRDSSHLGLQLLWNNRQLYRGIATATPVRFPVTAPPENRPEDRLQFYFTCDQQHSSFRFTRGLVNALRGMKFPVVLTAGDGDAQAWPNSEVIEEIGRWADSLDRI